MSMEPLVTVLIPVYNRPYVVNTIKSICNQTYKNLEILVIDNASTDHTVQAIQELKDSRIRLLINEKNRGQTYSLNRGLEEASGKYIARIDSDDIAKPERIEKQIKFMEEHNDYVLVGSWVQFISDDDKPGMIVPMCTTDKGMRLMQTVACGMYHPSAMYKRSTVIENHIRYDENIHMAEDYDLWVKLMKCGKACNIGEPLIFYRRGSNNDSRHHQDMMGRESTEIRRKVCSELECNEKEKMRIVSEIDLEEKHRKSILDCVKICMFYRNYLNDNLDRHSSDYPILKLHFQIKAYGACFSTNPSLYAACIRKVYILARNIKNRVARRK